jgi:hypothetical protein
MEQPVVYVLQANVTHPQNIIERTSIETRIIDPLLQPRQRSDATTDPNEADCPIANLGSKTIRMEDFIKECLCADTDQRYDSCASG